MEWCLGTSFLNTLGGSLLRVEKPDAFSQPGPDIPHLICVTQCVTSFRSLVHVSGKPSLVSLFVTATPTLQHYFSPYALLFCRAYYLPFCIQGLFILQVCPHKGQHFVCLYTSVSPGPTTVPGNTVGTH